MVKRWLKNGKKNTHTHTHTHSRTQRGRENMWNANFYKDWQVATGPFKMSNTYTVAETFHEKHEGVGGFFFFQWVWVKVLNGGGGAGATCRWFSLAIFVLLMFWFVRACKCLHSRVLFLLAFVFFFGFALWTSHHLASHLHLPLPRDFPTLPPTVALEKPSGYVVFFSCPGINYSFHTYTYCRVHIYLFFAC